MRSSVFAIALLAASAVASPIKNVRDVQTDVVYVTQTFYVTAGAGHGYRKNRHTSIQTQTTPVVVVTETPSPTPEAQAPAPEPQTPDTPTVAEVPGPSPTPSAYSAGDDYISRAVNSHNVHRSNHSAGAVSWDTELASIAAQIASSCVFQHDTTTGGGDYGQNIAAGNTPEEITKIVSDGWYNSEVDLYNQYGAASPDMSNFEAWGHFSQIVWKDTDRIGCATQQCPNGVSGAGNNVPPYFTVCNYRKTGK
ncbi:MAG: hypothetical protein M1840_000066 [Geoglossum simile]|nr:MAG: hypothetical protein M1840_000066 [Geoglossum simile]